MTTGTKAASGTHLPGKRPGGVQCTGSGGTGPGLEPWLHTAGCLGSNFRVCPAGPEHRSCELAWLTLILSLQSKPALQFSLATNPICPEKEFSCWACSFTDSITYSITYTSLYSFIIIYSLIHIHFSKITLSFTHSLMNFFTYLFTYSFIAYLFYLLIISLLLHSPFHSLPHSLTPFMHWLAQSLTLHHTIPQRSILPGRRACIRAGSISPHSQNLLFHFNFQLAELCRQASWCAEDTLSTQEQMFL